MRSLRHVSRGLLLAAALAAFGPARSDAGNCDYKLLSASWSAHPSPDSIFVNFSMDVSVDFHVSTDPANPSQFPMQVAIRWNGSLLDPIHEVNYAWWQREAICAEPCNPVVCEIKAWLYKGKEIRDQSVCTRKPVTNVCDCPQLNTPVVEHKPVLKPPGNGMIEIELIPLSLTSCNPINPQNNKIQIPYPGGGSGGGNVPAIGRFATALLAATFGLIGLLALRRRLRRETV